MQKLEAITCKFIMGMEIGRIFIRKEVSAEMREMFCATYDQSVWSRALRSMSDEGTVTRLSMKVYQRTEPKQRPVPVAKHLQLADVSDLDLLLELRRRGL